MRKGTEKIEGKRLHLKVCRIYSHLCTCIWLINVCMTYIKSNRTHYMHSGSLSRVWLCDPIGCSPLGTSVYGILPLQGIFPTQGSNLRLLCLLHWQVILYHCAAWEAPVGHSTVYKTGSEDLLWAQGTPLSTLYWPMLWKSLKQSGSVYMYNWFTLLYTWN